MGMMKQHLMDFQDSWDVISDAAHRGVEADMVEEVAEVLGTFVEIWDETTPDGPKHWVVPAGLFQGLENPIEVSPAFRGRVDAFLDAIRDEAFEEWVAAMEADPVVQALAFAGGAA